MESHRRREADGFITHEDGKPKVTFTKSPVAFLKVFLTKVRHNCEDIDRTHWGRILNGEVLRKPDFDKGIGIVGTEALVL